MTDPWADTRARLKGHEAMLLAPPTGDTGKAFDALRQELTNDAFDILTDADALLAVARAAQDWADNPRNTKELGRALAALPEHLK